MSEGSELHQSTLRATLYALMELTANLDGSEVPAHLTLHIPHNNQKPGVWGLAPNGAQWRG